MNPKTIGNIGEAKVLSKFAEYGISVYIPFGDNEKSDLIAEFDGKLNKIQVKTSIKAENGKITFDLTSAQSNSKTWSRHIYTKDEIDYFACYNIARDKVFLISINDAPNTTISIRFEKTKNNQTKGIIYEDKYLIDNVLGKNNFPKVGD